MKTFTFLGVRLENNYVANKASMVCWHFDVIFCLLQKEHINTSELF